MHTEAGAFSSVRIRRHLVCPASLFGVLVLHCHISGSLGFLRLAQASRAHGQDGIAVKSHVLLVPTKV